MKGKYIIWIEENDDNTMDVYSTDSPFWRDFYHDDEFKEQMKKDIGYKKDTPIPIKEMIE